MESQLFLIDLPPNLLFWTQAISSLLEVSVSFWSSDMQFHVALSLSPLQAWVFVFSNLLSFFPFILFISSFQNFVSIVTFPENQLIQYQYFLWVHFPIYEIKQSFSPLQHLEVNPVAFLSNTWSQSPFAMRIWEFMARAENVLEMLMLDLGCQSRWKCFGLLMAHRGFHGKFSYVFYCCSYFREF